MSKILGRTDDMLIVRGVNVFPSQVEAALLQVEGLAPQYVIVVDKNRERLDELEIWVEPASGTPNDFELQKLQKRAQDKVESLLGIRARVRVVQARELARSEGKAVRVVDRRSI
jgi:phenylacetate-CoA ligase